MTSARGLDANPCLSMNFLRRMPRPYPDANRCNSRLGRHTHACMPYGPLRGLVAHPPPSCLLMESFLLSRMAHPHSMPIISPLGLDGPMPQCTIARTIRCHPGWHPCCHRPTPLETIRRPQSLFHPVYSRTASQRFRRLMQTHRTAKNKGAPCTIACTCQRSVQHRHCAHRDITMSCPARKCRWTTTDLCAGRKHGADWLRCITSNWNADRYRTPPTAVLHEIRS